jgi:signal peptidase I
MRRFLVAGDSMLPALRPGDVVLCRVAGGRIHRGELVVFPHPRRPGMTLVKRVIGLPGESITIDFGEVTIDGRRGLDRWGTGFTLPEGGWEPGAGEAFVLSDNRPATRDDSRHFGPVPIRDLRRVWWRVRIGDRGTTEADPSPPGDADEA